MSHGVRILKGMSTATDTPIRRPLGKRALHLARRAHLYLGLFFLPWTVLYGVTAFLFNHPMAFSDRPTSTFGRSELAGTPMERPPSPVTVAEQVVAALNARSTDGAAGVLVEPEKAKYNREFAFATVKTDAEPIAILIEVGGSGGTVRSQSKPAVRSASQAPFAIGGARPMVRTESKPVDALTVPDPLHERFRQSIPTVLERTGYPAGEATVTSVPDLMFRMERGGQIWIVGFNSMTGAVTGQPASDEIPEPISARTYLVRLHSAHGYPTAGGVRWWWALIVDAMAIALCFWGLSGLLMAWQVKAARRIGAVVLLLSALAAGALGYAMHAMLAS